MKALYTKYEKWIHLALWIGVLGLGIFTRLWRVDTIPSGIHIDEAGMAYDAWCLSEFGVDRYLKSWPAYLINFGGGQSSLYAFLTVPFIKVFGFHVLTLRLPAIIFSVLNIFYGMKVAQKMFGQKSLWQFALGALLVICPYFVQAGRYGYDCNLMLGVSTAFLYYLVCAIETDAWKYYLITGFVGGILLWTYALTYIIVPVFLLFVIIYLCLIRKFRFKRWMIMALPMGVLALPLILVQVVNMFDLEEFRIGLMTITKLEVYRSGENQPFQMDLLKQALISMFYGDGLYYNCVPGEYNFYRPTAYLFQLGLVGLLIKLVINIKNKVADASTLVLFWMLAVLYYGSHIISRVTRINGIYFAVVAIAVWALWLLSRIKGKLKVFLLTGVGVVYLLSFLRFGDYYYNGQYTAETYPLTYFDVTIEEGLAEIEKNRELDSRKTYIKTNMEDNAIYYAISALPSPYDFDWSSLHAKYTDSYKNYCFGLPQVIDENANYIVTPKHASIINELRERGFSEKAYAGYFLFYKD